MSKTRQVATQILYQVVVKHQHLKFALAQNLPNQISDADKAWVQHACYQTLRHHYSLQDRWQKFTQKPIKDKWISELLTLSLCQKFYMSTPDHAIVNEAIKTAKKNKKQWASGLLNKVLKLAMNDDEYQPKNNSIEYEHPQWWLNLLIKDWPKHYLAILTANNQKPPLWVRSRNSGQQLAGQQHPSIKSAWLMTDHKSSQSQELLGGQYSVQDAAAQLAAEIIAPESGEFILDACAAPGGKSCHLLEYQNNIKLDILEKDPQRLSKVAENLGRLNLSANRLIQGDATQPDDWYQDSPYDKILLDVPCSASGVVRRNPDIKILRQAEHLQALTSLQQEILGQIASLVKVGGLILYVTCSVFRCENQRQIKKFLKSNTNFTEIPLNFKFAESCKHGIQIITGTDQMDGFYYCLLKRNS